MANDGSRTGTASDQAARRPGRRLAYLRMTELKLGRRGLSTRWRGLPVDCGHSFAVGVEVFRLDDQAIVCRRALRIGRPTFVPVAIEELARWIDERIC